MIKNIQNLQSVLRADLPANAMLDKYKLNTEPLVGCIIALGSNYEADRHLAIARERLQSFATGFSWSSPYENPDYTATKAKPKPNYTNQCGYLHLKDDVFNLSSLIQGCKDIEKLCKRYSINMLTTSQRKQADDFKMKLVSIDIDILAVILKIDSNSWRVIEQRYPFRAHERIGIEELYEAHN